jgi:endo-1,4-beta-xylanase
VTSRRPRTVLAGFTALLLAAGAVAAAPAAVAAPTTVSSVDFSDGTTGAWVASGGGADTLDVVDLEGGTVLQVTGRDADYVGIQSPPGLLQPGAQYTFSMRVKLAAGTAGTPGVRFVVKPAYTWVGNTTMSADAWTTVTGQYTAPADADAATLQAYIGTGDLAAPYTYLVDDISITTEAVTEEPGGGDVVPGGAVDPTTTEVASAQGTGDVAALTFDDGPNPGTTPELLDYLAEKDIRAVFCVIGQNIEAPGGADLLRRIVADGHVLCNHSTGYADMGGYTAAQVRADLVANLDIIRTALGDPNAAVPFWRAPNGSWGVSRQVAVDLGMQPLAVTNTIDDWATQDVTTLTANLRAAMKPGQIVLAHDGGGDRDGTLAAVRTVVDERLAAGWTFTLPTGTPAGPVTGPVLSTGFEDGLDGWGPRSDGTGTPTVDLVGTAHSGTQAARVSARTSQGSGIGHDVTGILIPGRTYTLDAWVRFADGQPADDVWLSMARTVDGETTYSTLGQFSGISNSTWTRVSLTFPMGAADTAQLYFETDYNGTNTSDLLFDDITVAEPEPAVIQDLEPIKDTVDFPVGVAIDSRETQGAAAELLLRHFDQVTPENHMKPEAWYTADGTFQPAADADAVMQFAQQNDLGVYGHVLVWHSQTPAWFFQNAQGQPLGTSEADKATLRERMRTHIFSVAEYLSSTYGEFGSDTNPLRAFDVVNEVVSDGGEFADGLRRSDWYRTLGEEFIDLAFQYADEAFNEQYAAPGADRPVTLFINDYNTEQAGKQQRYLDLITRLLDRGVPVDGVGHQFHVSLAMPVSALEGAIERFADLPVTQAVTELDVTTGTPVTEAKLVDQGYYYRDAFRAFREHAEDIYSVTVWGLTDGRSWRVDNGAPLVFDDGYQAKPAYDGIVDGALPAPLRTANVFRGDVPLDDAAPASLEWEKLPLLPIEGDSAFQLRWEADHLTAYVSVSGDADGVEFDVDGRTFRIGRDGVGDAEATVTPRENGFDLVAHLPLEAALGDTVPFDVRITDGGTATGWNAPGVQGTLTLVEPLSYVEVAEASSLPIVDGEADDVWADAEVVTTGTQVSGTDTAAAEVRTLWADDTLYVRAEVDDSHVDVSGSDPWVQDSVEIFVDAGNYKNGSYRYDDTQIRISATNVVSFGTGDEAFQRNRVVSATKAVDGGYVVEAAVSLLEEGGEGTFHGLDFQVNDATAGARDGIRNWADPTGAGYQSTARWGVGRLVSAVGTTPTPPTTDPGENPAGAWATVDVGDGVVEQGGSLPVRVSGLDAGQRIGAVLYSEPIVVNGIAAADGSGRTSFAVAIPADLPLGTHTLVVTSDGEQPISVTVTVVAGGSLGVTGSELPWGLALLSALAVVLGGLLYATRRRNVAADPTA